MSYFCLRGRKKLPQSQGLRGRRVISVFFPKASAKVRTFLTPTKFYRDFFQGKTKKVAKENKIGRKGQGPLLIIYNKRPK
jgi:hypothetical protein